ncbi:hypothetical protein PARA125_000689 [Parachlamydia sp. AcF125]|nr:hypothetical protein [Parachlamydia sp. AcF125]
MYKYSKVLCTQHQSHQMPFSLLISPLSIIISLII